MACNRFVSPNPRHTARIFRMLQNPRETVQVLISNDNIKQKNLHENVQQPNGSGIFETICKKQHNFLRRMTNMSQNNHHQLVGSISSIMRHCDPNMQAIKKIAHAINKFPVDPLPATVFNFSRNVQGKINTSCTLLVSLLECLEEANLLFGWMCVTSQFLLKTQSSKKKL